MSKFTELSAKDINEVNGGRILLPYVITGPSPYISALVLGIATGAIGAAFKK